MTSLSSQVEAIHADRLSAARAAAAAGTPVVGLIGTSVPREVILAAGCFPILLTGRPQDSSIDSSPMEAEHEAEVRSLFLQAVAGDFECCDLIVIASTSDAYRYLYQYLKEMVRSGRGEAIPPLMLYDFLFGDSPAVRAYSRQMFNRLVCRVESLSGRSIVPDAMASAIDRTNAVRRALADVARVRASGQLAGTGAVAAIGAGQFLSPEDDLALLQRTVESARSNAATNGPRTLIKSSAPLYHTVLHELLESAGAYVISEDDEFGARRAGPEIPSGEDACDALFEHYRAHPVSPRQPTARRESWFVERLHELPDAVVFYVPPEDHVFGWRYPALAALASPAGVPSLLIRDDVLDPAGLAKAADQASAFFSELKGAKR